MIKSGFKSRAGYNGARTVYRNGILLPKLFWPTVRKNCSSDWEKLMRSLEQSIQTVKGQNNFW